ncbi:MAG: hypothetical protein EOO38_22540, partial [Cytophagaceae bacterium]
MVTQKSETKPIPRSTAYRRKQGGRTISQKAEDQAYLTKGEKQTLLVSVRTKLQAVGRIHTREVRTQATEIKRHRPQAVRSNTNLREIQAPGKNWATNFLNAHRKELNIKSAQGLGWLMVIADFHATPSDVERLCAECAAISFRLETVLPRRPNESRKVHTIQSLPEGVEKISCKLCRFVLACAKAQNWPTATRFSLQIQHLNSVFGPTLADGR